MTRARVRAVFPFLYFDYRFHTIQIQMSHGPFLPLPAFSSSSQLTILFTLRLRSLHLEFLFPDSDKLPFFQLSPLSLFLSTLSLLCLSSLSQIQIHSSHLHLHHLRKTSFIHYIPPNYCKHRELMNETTPLHIYYISSLPISTFSIPCICMYSLPSPTHTHAHIFISASAYL